MVKEEEKRISEEEDEDKQKTNGCLIKTTSGAAVGAVVLFSFISTSTLI